MKEAFRISYIPLQGPFVREYTVHFVTVIFESVHEEKKLVTRDPTPPDPRQARPTKK